MVGLISYEVSIFPVSESISIFQLLRAQGGGSISPVLRRALHPSSLGRRLATSRGHITPIAWEAHVRRSPSKFRCAASVEVPGCTCGEILHRQRQESRQSAEYPRSHEWQSRTPTSYTSRPNTF